MARQIADNLLYKAPRPLDDRLVVKDISDLVSLNPNFCYDGMRVYVVNRAAFYVYDSHNENAGTMIGDLDAVLHWRRSEEMEHAKTDWKDSEDILPSGEGDPNTKMLEHKWYLELNRNRKSVLIFDNHAYSYVTEVEGLTKDDTPCTYLIYQCTCANVSSGLKPDSDLNFAARILEISSETMYKTGIQYHYAYHRTVSMGGGSLQYVAELPELSESNLGDMFGLRSYKRVIFFNLYDDAIADGCYVSATGVYIASESKAYTWDEIKAEAAGGGTTYGDLEDWFRATHGDIFGEEWYPNIGTNTVVLYEEYVDDDHQNEVKICAREGWEYDRTTDQLYVRGSDGYTRISSNKFGGVTSIVFVTADEYDKIQRNAAGAIYPFSVDTIYFISDADEEEPKAYLCRHNIFSAGSGGDGDIAKRLSNLGKENRIAATDKDDFYGLLWDIDMSKYSSATNSRPTETRVFECIEYVPTASGTILTEAVGGIATVSEVVTPVTSGEWDSYIFIEFKPHEFTKYSQTTFFRRIAVQFDTDKVGQFSKGVLAFDLSADTGWVTSVVSGDIKPDDKTIEKNPQGKLQLKNEGVTKSKINSEAGVVFEEDTQELKNKTIDATKNTFKNLSLTAFGDQLIDKSALTTTDDNHIATSKLIKNYADTKITIPSTRATKVMAWNAAGNTSVLTYKKQYEHFFAVKRINYNTNYITFRYVDTTASPTVANMIKWIYDKGFRSSDKLYPAAGLAAANTVYVASSSGGSPTTQFSMTSCINGIYSPDGSKLCYTYRAGTNVDIDAARIAKITDIELGYILTD